jgi:hypothetical protein
MTSWFEEFGAIDGWEGKKGREKEREEVRRRPASTSEKEKKTFFFIFEFFFTRKHGMFLVLLDSKG